MTSAVNDRHDCLNRCIDTAPCDTVQYNYRTKACVFLQTASDAQPQSAADWEVMRLCELEEPVGAHLQPRSLVLCFFMHDANTSSTLETFETTEMVRSGQSPEKMSQTWSP